MTPATSIATLGGNIPATSSLDHNFKNLILDYPRQALAFLAAEEAHTIGAGCRIMPLREEQLKERLGERFRELDVALLVVSGQTAVAKPWCF